MISVAIIEDFDDVREGLALLISGTPGFQCPGAFGDCEAALEQLPQILPDVLLLDINLPGMSGLEALPRLRVLLPDTHILILTVSEDNQHIFEALQLGARGYLLKTTPPAKLLHSIEEVCQGGAPLSKDVARTVIHSFHRQPRSGLTRREREILSRLCKGESYKMIADRLFISKGTVHCHIKNIYRKLGVHSNAQAVARALQEQLV